MKAAFLDRDGVVNIDKNHVFRIKDFEFVENIFPVCRKLISLNYKLFIVTNQAGIAKKFYTVSDFKKLTSWMLEIFKKNDVVINDIYYCPHHPDFTGECPCRKPKPGMLKQAFIDYGVDPKSSILIGDKMSDIEAGFTSGLKVNFLFSNTQSNVKKKNFVQIQDLNQIFRFL